MAYQQDQFAFQQLIQTINPDTPEAAALRGAGAVRLSLSDAELKLAAAELKHLLGAVPERLLKKGPELSETIRRTKTIA